jgi:dihydroorotate dehydrogenase (NAD+) catalytic subunit
LQDVDLAVELAGVKMNNPVVLASGTAGYGIELSSITDLSRVGGLVLKSVTVDPRKGNREPRVWETAAGMLNSIGLENVGVQALARDIVPALSGLGIPIFASIAGDTVRSFARLAALLDRSGGVDALELNVSCPNVEKGGIHFGVDAGATSAIVMSVKENCGVPVFVKLTAAVADVSRIAVAAQSAGADGLALINTIPGIAIDPVTRRPRLGAMVGGLSGPAIKPVALKAVWDCYTATDLPILGGGGAYDTEDVLEFLVAGASAVSLGTAILKEPGRAVSIIEELPEAVKRAGAGSVNELIGTLKTPGGWIRNQP